MEATYTQLDEDEERFRKLQSSDQANFNDRLDTLQVLVLKKRISIILKYVLRQLISTVLT